MLLLVLIVDLAVIVSLFWLMVVVTGLLNEASVVFSIGILNVFWLIGILGSFSSISKNAISSSF